MVLKRVEKENKVKAIYESSNILASTYDKTDNSLVLIFKKGAQYKYPNVGLSDYTRFEMAESQGVVFNTHIKKYEHEKMDAIDPTEIVNEIAALGDAENKAVAEARQLKLINTMKTLVGASTDAQGNTVILTVDQLTELQGDLTPLLETETKTA